MDNNNKKTPLYTQKTLLLKLRDQYDESSWQRFIAYYENYIYVVIKNLGINTNDIDDVAQEILLKLWKKLPEFEYNPKKGAFRSWLITVIRFHIYSLFRSNKKKLNFTSEEAIEAEIDSIAEKEWMQHLGNLAWDAIEDRFSEQVKNAYIRLSHGEIAKDIAVDLQISRDTVYVYKERIQKALRQQVRHLDKELG